MITLSIFTFASLFVLTAIMFTAVGIKIGRITKTKILKHQKTEQKEPAIIRVPVIKLHQKPKSSKLEKRVVKELTKIETKNNKNKKLKKQKDKFEKPIKENKKVEKSVKQKQQKRSK